MTLDPTSRESNFRDSMKKFFVDNLTTTEGIPVLFDSTLTTPNIRGRSVDRWYKVLFGNLYRDTMSDAIVRVVCCTKEDNEGFKLAQLGDKLLGYLTVDPSDSSGDKTKHIDFYQSNVQPWVKIGGIIVQNIDEIGEDFSPDKTKFKTFIVRLRFASKL